MNDPKTINPGTYQTITGEIAHVWKWGQNMIGEWCYLGTVEGQGFCSWDKKGKDLVYENDIILDSDKDFN